MTEAEWLGCTDPDPMIGTLFAHKKSPGSDRQHRLFVCACCRRIWDMLIDKRSRAAVEASEGYADGQVTETDLGAFQAESDAALEAIRRGKRANSPEARTASIAWIAAENYPGGIWNAPYEILGVQGINVGAEKKAQCAILRDICNPFHPVVLAKSWLAWNGGMVRKIAQAIYDERAFERMPILADVLEDAGCDDADLLAHCRGPGPHARGCWVVDLLLGKE